jgi:hypothetical protein
MSRFVDNAQRTWSLDLNVTLLRQIKQDLDVDLYRLDDQSMLMRLASDPFLLAEVLYLVCREQAESQGVSPESFGTGLAGDAIDAASTALLEAIADFFPNPRKQLVRGVIAKLKDLDQAMLDQAAAELEAIDIQTLAGQVPGAADSGS